MYPVIFESSIFTVYSLWLFFTLGFGLGAFIFYQLIHNSRLDISFITNNALKFLVGALVSSRVFAIITNPRYFFRTDPETGFSIWDTFWNLISIWDKELSFWGAVAGFLFIFIREAQKEIQNFAKWMDILTISLVSGLSIGNIGAYLDGINYGNPTEFFWGVTYQSSFVKYAVPVHPTQLYAFIYTALIAIFIYQLYKRYRNKYDGLIAYTGFFLFCAFRFLEGFFRGDDVMMLGPIRLPQLIFLGMALLLGYLMRKYQKRYNIPVFSLIPKYLYLDRINWSKLRNLVKKK